MAEAQYAPHNSIDPVTGFTENKSYFYSFDAERKQQFIDALVINGLGIYDACDALHISHHTINKHYQSDPAFKEALDTARHEYGDRLDAMSKKNAMNPKSVIERIFQLKSIFPERYADKRSDSPMNITISLDGKLLDTIKKRNEIIDIEPEQK